MATSFNYDSKTKTLLFTEESGEITKYILTDELCAVMDVMMIQISNMGSGSGGEGGIKGPTTSTIGNLVTFNDNKGGSVADSGVPVSDILSKDKITGYLRLPNIGSFNDVEAELEKPEVTNAESVVVTFMVSNSTYGDEGGMCVNIYTQGKAHQMMFWKDKQFNRTLDIQDGVAVHTPFVETKEGTVYLPNRGINGNELFKLTTSASSEEIQNTLKFDAKNYPVITAEDLDRCLSTGSPIVDIVMNTPIYVGWDGNNYTLFEIRLKAPNKDFSLYRIGLSVTPEGVYSITHDGSSNTIVTEDKLADYATVDSVKYVNSMLKDGGDAVQLGDETKTLNINSKDKVIRVNSYEKLPLLTPDLVDPERHFLALDNYDAISSFMTTEVGTPGRGDKKGDGATLIMLSKWNKVDVGSPKVSMNLNTSDIVTINDNEAVMSSKDIYGEINLQKYNGKDASYAVYPIEQSFVDDLGNPELVDNVEYSGTADDYAPGKLKVGGLYLVIGYFDEGLTFHYDLYTDLTLSKVFKSIYGTTDSIYKDLANKLTAKQVEKVDNVGTTSDAQTVATKLDELLEALRVAGVLKK